jgi:ornithine cyclodeaminase/alanine dehydrogenase-like protein (mu-crystallin family)
MTEMSDFATNHVVFLTADDLRDHGADLSTGELLSAAGKAWSDIRAGVAFGAKAVLSLPEDGFWTMPEVMALRPQFANERLGWKLSCLYAVNDLYGGVKVIGANAFNRTLGLPRSTSTILLFEKKTLRLLSVMDGTALSARRTGTYATTVMELFCGADQNLSVFLFGTGPIARAIIECLDHRFGGSIERIFVRGRTREGSERFADEFTAQSSIRIEAAVNNEPMASCAMIITATNARQPLFADEDLARDAVTLHLGGDEVPETYLKRALRSGLVVCDDTRTVSRRNSQSIALHFSRRDLLLEQVGPLIGVTDLSAHLDTTHQPGLPVCVTCVGLPMLDLYAAQATFEKHRRCLAERRA